MTKREALTICRDLWYWLAENPTQSKHDWPGWKTAGYMLDNCPCCHYMAKNCLMCRNETPHCETPDPCILPWPQNNCMAAGSPYIHWRRAVDNNARKKYAKEIVEMCRNALDELDETGDEV